MSFSGENPAASNIRVKLLLKSPAGKEAENLRRRFPGGQPVWGGCEFIFDYDCRDYDWLVVYDDLPPVSDERFTLWRETLACPRRHSLLITNEPSTIKTYGSRFLGQFGHVLTSQEPWMIQHAGAIFSQPALLWFYGRTDERGRYETMVERPPVTKTREISTVCSSKQQTHTLHQARYEFTQRLRQRIPELEVFGHGVRPITDKAEALDDYRYHLAIENHVARHHWTEKLSDAFLGHCLPFYFGCPNAEDYFPAESFIRIDIHHFEEAVERIIRAMRDGEYEKRLPAIREARRRVLEDYGIFAVVSRVIGERHDASAGEKLGEQILSRRALHKSSVGNALAYAFEKFITRYRHRRFGSRE